jgi:hypothetical protein
MRRQMTECGLEMEDRFPQIAAPKRVRVREYPKKEHAANAAR